jgi:hypothetical protein
VIAAANQHGKWEPEMADEKHGEWVGPREYWENPKEAREPMADEKQIEALKRADFWMQSAHAQQWWRGNDLFQRDCKLITAALAAAQQEGEPKPFNAVRELNEFEERLVQKALIDSTEFVAEPEIIQSADGDWMCEDRVATIRNQIRKIARLRAALKPFADFCEKAEAFVEARAKDAGSPVLPSTDFRLSDFRKARAALTDTTPDRQGSSLDEMWTKARKETNGDP